MKRTSSPNRVAVLGCGITGATTAYQLIRRGCDVTIFERHPFAAMETSYANGGQLSASNAEVWTRWATILKGIKWLFSPGAPLLVHPAPTWHKLSWMAEFMAAIPNYEKNTIATARLAIEARHHLLDMARDEEIDFNCERRGILHFYKTKADFDDATRVTKILAKAGLKRRAVTPSEMRDIEPALKSDVVGGYYTESDFTGDIHKFTYQLARACQRRGATMRLEREIERVERKSEGGVRVITSCVTSPEEPEVTEEFDAVVICCGIGSRNIAAQLGDRVNIYPVKGYSITVELFDETDRAAAPWVSLLDDQAKLVTSRLGADRFRVAGTAEFSGVDRDIRETRIAPLRAWCRHNFPDMSTRHAEPWAGLRPMMPNMMPHVGAGKHPGVFYNTGHGHLGWTLSGATASAIAARITGEPEMAPVSVARTAA